MSSTTCTNFRTQTLSLKLTEEFRKYPNPVKESCVSGRHVKCCDPENIS